jgi:iron complex outermembrane receptor protein
MRAIRGWDKNQIGPTRTTRAGAPGKLFYPILAEAICNRCFATMLALLALSPAMAQDRSSGDLADLSLEQLSNVEITSVSRRSERLSDAPASIYVISNDDIRRSGATSLPEALRLAPNLEIARVSASTYAISARGFNNSLGNKLLVLIDGRTVYTPLFSGVFWDAQDVLLEDVDRIEVISGPGATLWGANAVNGVINVITRSAANTQGLLVGGTAGGDERSALIRYGGALGASGHYRVYAKRNAFDNTESVAGNPQPDGWNSDQVGFRADWGGPERGFTVQGDHYNGKSEPRPFGPIQISGTNLLANWNRQRPDGSGLRLQSYFDRTERDDPITFHDRMDVLDFEFQQDFPLRTQDILWGGGYRHAHDETGQGLLTTFIPATRNLHWENVFVQDEIRLRKNVDLTLGVKLDRNIYTGTEILPNVRFAWKPASDQLLWASASRAVRAPSRIDKEFFFPGNPPYLITGGPDFVSEISNVFEVGYRAQPTNAASFSVTVFHHRHENLRSGEQQPDGSFQVQNGTAGWTTGLEAWGNLQVTRRWRLSGGLVELHQHFWTKPGFHDPDGAVDLGNDPKHQWSLRSMVNVTPTLDFDVMVRSVSALPAPRIAGYTAVDASLGWRPNAHIELSLFLKNMFGAGHVEFAPGPLAAASDYDRSASARLLWRW